MTNAILPPYASYYLKGNDTWSPSQQHLNFFFSLLIMKVGDGRWGRLPTPRIWILEISSQTLYEPRGLGLKSYAIPHDTKSHRISFTSRQEEKGNEGGWGKLKWAEASCAELFSAYDLFLFCSVGTPWETWKRKGSAGLFPSRRVHWKSLWKSLTDSSETDSKRNENDVTKQKDPEDQKTLNTAHPFNYISLHALLPNTQESFSLWQGGQKLSRKIKTNQQNTKAYSEKINK